MSVAPVTDITAGSVEVNGSVINAHVRLNDSSAAQFLLSKPADARVETAETALGIGFHALAAADSTVTERVFDEKLRGTIDKLELVTKETLERASADFAARWHKQVDEDLGCRLQAHREALSTQFRVLFEETNDGSIQKSIRRLLVDYEARVKAEIEANQAKMRRDLTETLRGTTDPDHPIARIHGELTKLREDIATQLEASRAALAGIKAMENRPQAGHAYEAVVHQVVADLAKGSDDEVERMGRRPGSTGGADR